LDTGSFFKTLFAQAHWATRRRRLKAFLYQFLAPLDDCPVAGGIRFVFELLERWRWRTTDDD